MNNTICTPPAARGGNSILYIVKSIKTYLLYGSMGLAETCQAEANSRSWLWHQEKAHCYFLACAFYARPSVASSLCSMPCSEQDKPLSVPYYNNWLNGLNLLTKPWKKYNHTFALVDTNRWRRRWTSADLFFSSRTKKDQSEVWLHDCDTISISA